MRFLTSLVAVTLFVSHGAAEDYVLRFEKTGYVDVVGKDEPKETLMLAVEIRLRPETPFALHGGDGQSAFEFRGQLTPNEKGVFRGELTLLEKTWQKKDPSQWSLDGAQLAISLVLNEKHTLGTRESTVIQGERPGARTKIQYTAILRKLQK